MQPQLSSTSASRISTAVEALVAPGLRHADRIGASGSQNVCIDSPARSWLNRRCVTHARPHLHRFVRSCSIEQAAYGSIWPGLLRVFLQGLL